MPRTAVAILGASLALVGTGCVDILGDPYLLKPTAGRAVRTFDADLATVARAELPALDSTGVKPRDIVIRDSTTQAAVQLEGSPRPNTNAELSGFLKGLGSPDLGLTVPFSASLVNYKGTTRDGRPVTLTAFIETADKARTTVFARVGNGDDKAEAEALLDQVAGQIQSKAGTASPQGPSGR